MKKVLFILVVGALAGAPAVADPTVVLKEVSTNPGDTMTIYTSGYDGGAWVGVYNLNILAPGYGALKGDVQSFCIDVWDSSPSSYQTYTVVPLDQAPDPGAAPVGGMGDAKARLVAQLLDKYWQGTLTTTEAVAIQLAVWEIVDDALSINPTSYDVTTGGFYATGNSAALTRANVMLDSLTAGGASHGSYRGLTNSTTGGILGTYQDYVVRVPIPGAVLLGLLGLGAAGARLRRFV
jgi:hypothetical protein